MASRNQTLGALVFALSLAPVAASAQYVDPEPQDEPAGAPAQDAGAAEPTEDLDSEGRPIVVADAYPLAYVDRPLNLRGGMIRLDGQFDIYNLASAAGNDTFAFANIGIGVGLTDSFEIGASSYRLASTQDRFAGAVPLLLSPEFEYGDIGIYGRYGLVDNEDFGLSLESTFVIPTDSDRGFRFRAGVPLRARLSRRFNLDAAFEVEFAFGQPDGTGGEETNISLLVPVAGVLQLAPQVWLAGRSGIYFYDFDIERFTIPLQLELGYTIGSEHPYLDIALTGGFPSMLQPGADGDKFRSDWWHVGVTLNGYFQL